jgi:carbon monoxide dehydrogenase subunit G
MTIVVQRTVRSDKPVERVADYLSRFETTADWDPHTQSCTAVDGGPVAEGKRYRNTQKIGPSSSTLEYRVVAYTPGRHVKLQGTNKTVDAVDEMTFEPVDGGTQVTYRAQFDLKGLARFSEPLAKLLLERIATDGQRGMEQALARL